MAQNGPRMNQNDPKWPKMTQNYPKWPKNNARIYALFPQIFLTEKAAPQTILLLECMQGSSIINLTLVTVEEGAATLNGLKLL